MAGEIRYVITDADVVRYTEMAQGVPFPEWWMLPPTYVWSRYWQDYPYSETLERSQEREIMYALHTLRENLSGYTGAATPYDVLDYCMQQGLWYTEALMVNGERVIRRSMFLPWQESESVGTVS